MSLVLGVAVLAALSAPHIPAKAMLLTVASFLMTAFFYLYLAVSLLVALRVALVRRSGKTTSPHPPHVLTEEAATDGDKPLLNPL